MSKQSSKRPNVKFVAFITNPKTGKRMYVRDYGKKAWPIPLGSGSNKKKG